jgi:hypothetical protein
MPFHDLHAITYYLHNNYIKYTWFLHVYYILDVKITGNTRKIRSNYDFTLVPPILESGGYLLYMEKAM